jgi:uncharacterized phage protein gp47/JayE
MQLQLQGFTTLVSNAAAAVQGAAAQLLDLTVGSVLRAVLEANAAMALWLQWLIVLVLQTTRAATSTGPDLDSWMADFGLLRLPAVASSGIVSFSRFVPSVAALVPIGTTVRTADGSQSLLVVADTTNTAFSAALGGFMLAVGSVSVNVPVVAAVAGSAGNVQAGSITLIAAALPGIDMVSNAAPLLGGIDPESDAALRSRFQNYLSSRSRATDVAVGYAVGSIQQGLQYVIQENVMPDGTSRMGGFVVTVDDGSGNPSSGLLASVAAAVEAVRPVGSSFGVLPPNVTQVTVSMSISVASGAVKASVAQAASAAVSAYINALPVGALLAWSRLAQLAYDASPAVINVSELVLNGGTADITPGPAGVIKAATVSVN